ncbi:MAG: hypothetical protein GBAus27B_000234 [Mycoplasmataceae bacterium]|nr:MAG: hypothetical protein GBAus27B_000234 [Mycoplasmataceae bacterium]
MTIKEILTQINQEFTNLKDKITAKLQTKDTIIQEEKTKSQENIHKLEVTLKENSENEKVLETLLQEFKEFAQQLD